MRYRSMAGIMLAMGAALALSPESNGAEGASEPDGDRGTLAPVTPTCSHSRSASRLTRAPSQAMHGWLSARAASTGG